MGLAVPVPAPVLGLTTVGLHVRGLMAERFNRLSRRAIDAAQRQCLKISQHHCYPRPSVYGRTTSPERNSSRCASFNKIPMSSPGEA